MANNIGWCDLCKREHPYPLKNTGPLSYVGLRLTQVIAPRDTKTGRFVKVADAKNRVQNVK